MEEESTTSTVNMPESTSNNLTDTIVYSRETYSLVKRVIKGLVLEEHKTIIENESSLERAARLTGLHKDCLKNIQDPSNFNSIAKIDRKIIHYQLMNVYLKDKTMITCTQLFNRVQSSLPCFVDIQSFQNMLVKSGYIFQKKFDVTVVVENPKVRFERYKYLKNLKQYRENNIDIYFIGEWSLMSYGKRILNIEESVLLNEEHSSQRPFIFAVSADAGVICYQEISKFSKENFTQFLINNFIPKLIRKSVIVYDNTAHHCETYCPRLENIESSLKTDIMAWLHFHKIPFNLKMTKLELWKLVETCTDLTENVYVADKCIELNNHYVQRLPNCMNDLTLATGVMQYAQESKIKSLDDLNELLKDKLASYNSELIAEESKLLFLEEELDNIWDNLSGPVTDPENSIDEDLELPSTSDIE